MKVRIDLPQNHQESVEFNVRLIMMDVIQDLIRNQNWEDEPTSWMISLEDDGDLRVDRVEPNLPKRPTKPNLRLVH